MIGIRLPDYENRCKSARYYFWHNTGVRFKDTEITEKWLARKDEQTIFGSPRVGEPFYDYFHANRKNYLSIIEARDELDCMVYRQAIRTHHQL